MPRYAFGQNDAVSCGAVVCMVALAELQQIPAGMISRNEEMRIWTNISGEGGESPPGLLLNFLAGNGAVTSFFEDTAMTAALQMHAPGGAFNYPYLKYRTELESMGYVANARAILPADFGQNARIILIVIINSPGTASHLKTHYVMARLDNGQMWVMNPDTGVDSQIPGLLAWMTGPAFVPLVIPPVTYFYSGMFLRAA